MLRCGWRARLRQGDHLFAFTMMTMAVSQLTVIGQVGTTIGLGLLFDTLVVRSLMTPSIAALLGKWFWWPQIVRQRPVPSPWPTPAMKAESLINA
jgi:putative drug exporter of the RND superfamily